jgi:hypothetical protein
VLDEIELVSVRLFILHFAAVENRTSWLTMRLYEHDIGVDYFGMDLGIQTTCGAATKPSITDENYFSLYSQRVEAEPSVGNDDPSVYWDMDISTKIPSDR